MTGISPPKAPATADPVEKVALVLSVGAAVLAVAVPPVGALASVVALIASPRRSAARVVALVALALSCLLTVAWAVAFHLLTTLVGLDLSDVPTLEDPIIATRSGEGPGTHRDGDVAFEVHGYVCEHRERVQECVVTVEATNTGDVTVELVEEHQTLSLTDVPAPVAAIPVEPDPAGWAGLSGELAPGDTVRSGLRFLVPAEAGITSIVLRSGPAGDGVRVDL